MQAYYTTDAATDNKHKSHIEMLKICKKKLLKVQYKYYIIDLRLHLKWHQVTLENL